jgi:hypothetical protein
MVKLPVPDLGAFTAGNMVPQVVASELIKQPERSDLWVVMMWIIWVNSKYSPKGCIYLVGPQCFLMA